MKTFSGSKTLTTTTLFTSVLVTTNAFAIVPVNDLIDVEKGLSGSFGLSLNGQSGNKDEQEYGVDALLQYAEGNNLFVFIGDYNYSETNDVKDEDELYVHGRWVNLNFFGDSLDSEVFVQYQYDDFADLSGRELIGANVRWRSEFSSDARKSQIILGLGAFHESEESEETTLSDSLVRANIYARYVYEKMGEFPFKAYISTYIQPAVDDLQDLRGLVVSGISFPIQPSLSIGLEFEITHNSTPFIDVEKTDIDYGITLNYSF